MAEIIAAPPAPPVNTGVATMVPSVADAQPIDEVDTDQATDDSSEGEDDQPIDDQPIDDQSHADDDASADKEKPVDKGKPLTQKQVNDKLKEISKTDPSLARQLRSAFNTEFQYKQIFPTPAEAKVAKEILANLGDKPTETLASYHQAQTDLTDLDAAIDASDPDFISAAFENHPEGMAGMGSAFVNELYKRNPEAYQKLTAPMIVNAFRHANGPVAYMKAASDLLRTGNPEDAKKALSTLDAFGNVLTELEDFIKASANDPLKAERDKLTARGKELDTVAAQNFNKTIDAQIFPIRDGIIAKALDPYVKGKNIDAGRLAAIKRNVLVELQNFADSDKNFMSSYNNLRNQKDPDLDRIVKYTGGRLEEILPGFVDTVAKQFGLSTSMKKMGLKDRERTIIRGDATGSTGGKGASEGTRDNPIRREPSMREIDMRRTSTLQRIKMKQAWDKSGKFYDWSNR